MQKNTDKDDLNNGNKISEEVLQKIETNNHMDYIYGYEEHVDHTERTGWLVNMKPTDFVDGDGKLVSAMVYYFLEEDGRCFKSYKIYQPYFYICPKMDCESEVMNGIRKKYDTKLSRLDIIEKDDLDLDNHLTGVKRKLIKMSFYHSDDLNDVKRDIMPLISKNRKKAEEETQYSTLLADHLSGNGLRRDQNVLKDWSQSMIDIREYDVPYHIRVSIDNSICVGQWFSVKGAGNFSQLRPRPDILYRPDPTVLAYDIETTKLPLKFPDSSVDQIMMISYMIDGHGYLICNREIISEHVEDFEFTPRPEFPGPFKVFNEPDEKATILKFYDHIRQVKPHIFVSYNGDFFDWPFVEARSIVHGIDMFKSIGFFKDSQNEYKSRQASHMDALQWVRRDSYLPVGSQGLKPVCKAKLHYDPVEVEPEDMVRLAREEPRKLANYSVSDAVATYYLYMRYVHPFIFALCTIIPMDPDEVLRKGSGTLCESLLMVEAYRANVIFPNKQQTKYSELTTDGHLLKSETYVGGHVEALESGVFRADVPTKFRVVPEMCQHLKDNLKETLQHALVVEEKVDLASITNFDEALEEVDKQLSILQLAPSRFENPRIYHLDVAAMYPNIILSNRLQPSALVTDRTCASCDYNQPNALCKRPMDWVWRAEVMPASRSEYYLVQSQLEREKFPPKFPGGPQRQWYQLNKEEQAVAERERMEKYCRSVYKRRQDTRLETKTSLVCQRENSFYVDTVRAFRDRRYEFKGLTKEWKKKLDNLTANGGDAAEIKNANGMLVLYDSLQLAHKCILNSFYGYVMRRGARWYSMEMAGIVCNTGGNIIRKARELIEQIGRPLELDTDGVWCILPSSFPETITFTTNNPKKPKIIVSYPGAVLNIMVQSLFTNDQYHDLVDPVKRKYKVRSENSIFFEVDGPYQAMILPASKEQGKKLKKRYAVFNFDGSLAELKGFEVKRNGELNLIKNFQSSVFEAFLNGTTLEEIYQSVAGVADHWLDLLYSKAEYMDDDELFELISERKVMSKKLEEYGTQKSTSISTAKRLAEFLGDEMVRDSGLSFKFIISKKPEGLKVTERAVPLAIFQAEESVKQHFLRKWLKCPELQSFDIRDILDWEYYIERFSSNVQKIITIPAALQHIANPVPRIPHPDWLQKRLLDKDDKFKQRRIDQMFHVIDKANAEKQTTRQMQDIEDLHKTTIVTAKKYPTNLKRPRPVENKDLRNLGKSWREASLGTAPKFPSKMSEFKSWLKFHKRKWVVQQAIRLRDRQCDDVDINNNNDKSIMHPPNKRQKLATNSVRQSNMSDFVTRARSSLMHDTWQIIQISETTIPGAYRAWVLLNNDQLQCVRLEINRVFYVNTRIAKDENAGHNRYFRKVQKTLPRSRTALHLYEYSIDELTYLEHESDILADFVRNEVEGVYELHVPLLFRALAKIGCLCGVDRNQKSAINFNNSIFQLDQLKQRSTAQHSYLDALNNNCLNLLFLFQRRSAKNQIIGIFNPTQKKASLVFVGTINSSTVTQLANFATNSFIKMRSEKQGEEDDSQMDNIQFDVVSDNSEINALKRVNKILLNYRQEIKTPTLLLTMTRWNLAELSKELPGVVNEFPIVTLNQFQADNSYNILDWHKLAVKDSIESYLKYPTELSSILDRSRYLHVPLGNIHPSYRTVDSCSDLLYARHLIKHDHVMWCSPSTSDPDFGGKETEDRRLMLLDNEGDNHLSRDNPGLYTGVCVALELAYMPINTILVVPKIHELIDGGGGNGGGRVFDSSMAQARTIDQMLLPTDANTDMRSRNWNAACPNKLSIYDDTAAAGPAFRLLRTMVTGWVEDVQKYDNKVADELVVGFYKWLRSSSALLHDPALPRTLHRLMRKLFFKLLETLSNLGMEPVHASLTRILLYTHRTDITDALLHVEHSTATLRNNLELFGTLDFQYLTAWDVLLWEDVHNFCGIRSNLADSNVSDSLQMSLSHSQEHSLPFSGQFTDADKFEIHFHLQRYLPSKHRGIHLRFVELLQCFMQTIWGFVKNEYELAQMDPASQQNQTTSDAGNYKTTSEKIDSFITDEMSFKIYDFISQLKTVSKFNRPAPIWSEETTEDLSPLLPMKTNEVEYPLVEFVNIICHILSLNEKHSKQVGIWRRNMLKILNIPGQCDITVQWKSPYAYEEKAMKLSNSDNNRKDLLVIVPELICTNCYMTRDLDLCRDSHCVRNDDGSWWFRCPSCEKPVCRSLIESKLTEQLNSLVELTLLQDMKCCHCPSGSAVLDTNFANARYCVHCGRDIICTLNTDLLMQKIKVYNHISRVYGLKYLIQLTDVMIEGI